MPEQLEPITNQLPECERWGCSTRTEEAVTVDGCAEWCPECATTYAYECERCGEFASETVSIDGDYGCQWCQPCADRWAFWCQRHQGHGTGTSHYVRGSGTWCEACADEDADYCDHCDTYSITDCECDGGVIKSYSYKPDPVFIPILPAHTITNTTPRDWRGPLPENGKCSIDRARLAYFGIELETEPRSYANYDKGIEIYKASPVMGEIYGKRDGSLDEYGVEWVSHPRTLASWQSWGEFGQFVEELRLAGWRSWDASNCGLHVHASRVAFDGASHLARLVYFFRRQQEGLQEFAGRSSDFARFSTLRDGPILSKVRRNTAMHFDALNLSNPATVEFRIFKPSLRIGRVLASVELCAALIEFTRPLSALELAGSDWFTFKAFVRANSNTYPHCLAVLSGHKFNTKESI